MRKKVIVLLAEGFEEVEAITPVDYMRRAGIDVTTAALNDETAVRGSHGIQIGADTTLRKLEGEKMLKAAEWDGVVIPGGLPGADNLAASSGAGAFIEEMAGAGKLICAVCAAPARVLYPLGLLEGKAFTCYPGEEKALSLPSGAKWKEDRVVADSNLITSRGAGTAGEFARAIIEKLLGRAEADKLAESVLL